MNTDVTSQRRLKWWQWALIALGVLVLAVWAIGAIAGPQPPQANNEGPTAASTTPAPSGTPAPTKTSSAPVEKPTESASPQATAKPTPSKPAAPETPKEDRGAVLMADITEALDQAGSDKYALRMIAVTSVSDEGDYLRVNFQNPITDKADAEDLVSEIFGFTMSSVFADGERTTIVVRDSTGRDTNVWVDKRDGNAGRVTTDPWG